MTNKLQSRVTYGLLLVTLIMFYTTNRQLFLVSRFHSEHEQNRQNKHKELKQTKQLWPTPIGFNFRVVIILYYLIYV